MRGHVVPVVPELRRLGMIARDASASNLDAVALRMTPSSIAQPSSIRPAKT
jgi:hypothetical protein